MPTVVDISPTQCNLLQMEPRTEEDALQEISLRFIREVKRQRGPDSAIAVINSLSETLGKMWSAKIIFDILGQETDPYPSLRLTFYSSFNAPINLIKCIRGATGMGLKESKDAVDTLRGLVIEAETKFGGGVTGNRLPPLSEMPYIRMPVAEHRQHEIKAELLSIGVKIL